MSGPQIHVHDSCPTLSRELASLKYTGDPAPHDPHTEDHRMDQWRYHIMATLKRRKSK